MLPFSKWPLNNVTKSCMGKRSIQSGRQTNGILLLQCMKSLTWFQTADYHLPSLVYYQRISTNIFFFLRLLIFPFPTTLCETRLPSYPLTKTTYHNRLKADAVLRTQRSTIKPVLKRSVRMPNSATNLAETFIFH